MTTYIKLARRLFGKIINCVTVKDVLRRLKRADTVFRNDDVSFDTDIERFRVFCNIFHKNGYKQLHGITLYGNTNCIYIDNQGNPLVYDNEDDISKLSYERIMQLSQDIFIGNNQELVDYINSIPDDIALHGLYHSDYSKMSYEQQDKDIEAGLNLLKELFPEKKVTTFIAPFNRINQNTRKICKKYNLKISANEGKHLEELVSNGNYGVTKKELYRYHHHRFYPESAFSYYKLSIEKLDDFLNHNKHILPTVDSIIKAVKQHNLHNWYIYAFQQFKKRKHAYLAYKWVKTNLPKDVKILASGCGLGDMLWHLYKDGYNKLAGYDIDENTIAACKQIADSLHASIDFKVGDGFNLNLSEKYDVILGLGWIYNVPDYTLDLFIAQHVKYLTRGGYFVFEIIDSSFNEIENNQYCTHDWKKPENERRQSEYFLRCSESEIKLIAEKYNLCFIERIDVNNHDVIPRKIYILQN